MRRLVALGGAIVLLAGCRGETPPATDPFFGRTRVAPPPTGSVSGAPVDPYYQGIPGPYQGTPGVYQAAPGAYQAAPGPYPATSGQGIPGLAVPPAVPGSVPATAPPSNYNPSGNTNFRGASLPGSATRAGTLAAAQGERPIRILPPRTSEDGPSALEAPAAARGVSPSSSGQPGVPSRVVDIADLPEPAMSSALPGPASAEDTAEVQAVSATEVQGPAGATAAVGSSVEAAGAAPTADYGYAPDYALLRGRLEYSQIDRQWKLRYIPVDGETDQYGGSVVLPDPSALAGCERGDFVEIRGRLGDRDTSKGFAPTYHVDAVERLGQP